MTPIEEAREARASLALYGHYGTPAQVAALTLALNAGARVSFVHHPTLGELSFLVWNPVSPEVKSALDALTLEPSVVPYYRIAEYVTNNVNYPGATYWCLDF